jgi:TetR/AcrR family acrAB operon transcriptional repressor
MSNNEERQQHILNAAAAIIMRQGYDKTTMSDIAGEAGVSRGIIYLHFASKEKLIAALFQREIRQYTQTWLEQIEADPCGGTMGGIYRAVLVAINSRPFMAAIMRQDRRVLGNYLRKPNNMFEAVQSSAVGVTILQALQDAGVVRKDVDPVITAHILDMLSYGLVTIQEFRPPEELPPFDVVMEALAHIMDQLLTPAGGGDSEAGKAVIRQLAATVSRQFEAAGHQGEE